MTSLMFLFILICYVKCALDVSAAVISSFLTIATNNNPITLSNVRAHRRQSIRLSRLRQSRDELCTSFIPSRHLCPIGRHSTMPDFSLFPTDVTNSVEISLRKCMSHPVAFTICCHQPVTPISPPGSEEHPYIRDLAIEPIVINHLSTMFS